MSAHQNRVLPGVPTGGQYAAAVHGTPTLTLTAPSHASDVFFDADGTEWDWDEREANTLTSWYTNGVGMRLKPRFDGTAGYEVIDQHTGKVLAHGTAGDTEEAKAEAKSHRDRLGRYNEGAARIRVGSRTPWGIADSVTHLAPGIDVIGTPGHGGVKLSRNRNREVDPAWRAEAGWYEQDEAVAIAVVSHPDGFAEDEVKAAHQRARCWRPEQYMAVVGADPERYGITDYRPVQPGESHVWDEAVFFRANHEDVEVFVAAVSSDRPGFIEVKLAAVDAEGKSDRERRRSVVMSSDEYGRMQVVGRRMVVPKGFEPVAA